ncbi:hypothetical protein GCM10027073_42380 [Streptomyces chlorus]
MLEPVPVPVEEVGGEGTCGPPFSPPVPPFLIILKGFNFLDLAELGRPHRFHRLPGGSYESLRTLIDGVSRSIYVRLNRFIFDCHPLRLTPSLMEPL